MKKGKVGKGAEESDEQLFDKNKCNIYKCHIEAFHFLK